jgi:CII-binding regulator of phage lambda lysogenization HflD
MEMAGASDDLRATQDSITADTKRLTELEERKRRLDADDPALAELSAEVEQLSQQIRHKSAAEGELVEEVQDETD